MPLDSDAALVVALVNTRHVSRDVPEGWDDLATPADLSRWWEARGGGPVAADASDLALLRDVREGLRALLAPHNDAEVPGDAAALGRLRDVLPDLPLQAGAGDAVLEPITDRPARAVPATVIAGMVAARAAGRWDRVKICRDPLCREAFVDVTRNGSRTWCSMQVCGARAKQRTFAERHRTG